MKIFDKITRVIAKIAEWISILMVAGMVTMIVAELINRNFLGHSFRATIEICGIMFLWMAFIGLIPLYERSGLMRLDFLVSKAKGALGQLLYFANKAASLLLGIVMIIAFFSQYPFVSTRYYSTIVWLPYTIQYVPMMIAGAFIAVRTVYEVIERIQGLAHGESFDPTAQTLEDEGGAQA